MSKRSILTAVVCVMLATPASAVTFLDIDALGGMKLSAGGTASYSDTFDITAAGIEGDVFTIPLPSGWGSIQIGDIGGFEVGVHKAVGASVLLGVYDDFDPSLEFMVVDLGNIQRFGPIEVDFGIAAFGVSATLLATIDATGTLDYEIIARSGDFRVAFGALYVQAVSAGLPGGASPMPEPESWATFALGSLLAFGAARRRRRQG